MKEEERLKKLKMALKTALKNPRLPENNKIIDDIIEESKLIRDASVANETILSIAQYLELKSHISVESLISDLRSIHVVIKDGALFLTKKLIKED